MGLRGGGVEDGGDGWDVEAAGGEVCGEQVGGCVRCEGVDGVEALGRIVSA